MKRMIVAVLLISGLVVQMAGAGIPENINFQGRLTDSSGNPCADGSYSVSFRIWDAASDGNMLWNDTYDAVQTTNGYFNVALGSGLTTFESQNLTFDQQYYLGMKVSGEVNEMTPRIKLASVPYALNVATNGLAGYLFYQMTILSVGSGTYTPSAGVRAIMVECVGGGGGGGSAVQSSTTSSAAGGGSGAGYCRKFITTLDTGYLYTVGAKGTGGSDGSNGADGADTLFSGSGVSLNAGKGRGGYGVGSTAWTSTGMVSNTVGGNATGGDINIRGQSSMYGIQIDLDMGSGGAGGNSYLGFGGHGHFNSGAGDGIGYGSGGGGGKANSASSNQSGADGSDGVIFVWEYK